MKRMAVVVWLLILATTPASAEEVVSTLTLDGLSFVSFGDREVLPLSGSTIKLRFAEPAKDGSVAFRIEPADVSMVPLGLSGGQTLQYSIASTSPGVMRTTPSGRTLSFTATVKATLSGSSNDGTYTYVIPFTTEHTSAPNLARSDQVAVSGMRVAEGAWYTQLVGATTNRENAFPEPGTAVYTVLSGQFDRMP